MGMNPDEYYNMLHCEFAAKMDGYGKRLYRERNDLRKAAFFSLLPHLEKGYSEDKFRREMWPLPGDEDINKPEVVYDPKISADMYKEIMRSHEKFKSRKKK